MSSMAQQEKAQLHDALTPLQQTAAAKLHLPSNAGDEQRSADVAEA